MGQARAGATVAGESGARLEKGASSPSPASVGKECYCNAGIRL